MAEPTGRIFSIERHALHDGDGIRTMVYLKGCPLRCLWCCNPESQVTASELAVFPERCIGCGACVSVCPRNAASVAADGAPVHDRATCAACGACVGECCAAARRLWGEEITVERALAEARKDLPFYRTSGGGLTLSGGEPLAQPDFAAALLRRCKELGLHTAIETSGYVPWEAIAGVLPFLDQVLYDVKHVDRVRHRELTGVDNDLILANLRRLATMGTRLTVRLPLVPGYNDDAANLRGIASLVRDLPGFPLLEILPYHNYGDPKYRRLGREYPLGHLLPPDEGYLDGIRSLLDGCDLRYVIA